MLYCLLLINAVSMLVMCLDKNFARRGMWRIPEAVLLGLAVCGGALGVLLGMTLFHHKTRKPKFYILVPLLLAAQVWLLLRFFAK